MCNSVRKDKRPLKKFPNTVAEVLAERDPEGTRPVVLMSHDEGRFGRISYNSVCWAPKGMRPKAPRQIVRKFLYVYAAVCMALGRMTSLTLPYANTEMMKNLPHVLHIGHQELIQELPFLIAENPF